MKIYKIPFFSIALLLVGCQADEPQPTQQQAGTLSFTTSVQQFEGEPATRTNLIGDAFEKNDKIKLKIVCPASSTSHKEFGESTYSGSFDGFWLLKWNDTAHSWDKLVAADGFDINGDYKASDGPDVYERYLAQPTPYVFTAQTWSEEQIYITGNKARIEQYSNVFHANQSKAANYKASDIMWAQTIQQTGSYNVHLGFKHVMAALLITVDADASFGISDEAVLTVEGMPDIDQAEVIVGDYYAAKSKINTAVDKQYDYSYKSKSSCDIGDNGKALGINVINDEKRTATCKLFKDITQKTTYTAYKDVKNTYRLIIPPYAINNATIMLRDGDKRYNMALNIDDVQPGTLYQITMTL
jgi:hypothetical protein